MRNSSQLLYFLPLLIFLFSTAASATVTSNNQCSRRPHVFEKQMCLVSEMQVAPVSIQENVGQPVVSTVNASVEFCHRLGGGKGTSVCSFLLDGDRPWRHWRQNLSRSISTVVKYVVKPVIRASSDGFHMVQVNVHDWSQTPSLYWQYVKSNLITLVDQCYYDFLNWYYGKTKEVTLYMDPNIFFGKTKQLAPYMNSGVILSNSSTLDLAPPPLDACLWLPSAYPTPADDNEMCMIPTKTTAKAPMAAVIKPESRQNQDYYHMPLSVDQDRLYDSYRESKVSADYFFLP